MGMPQDPPGAAGRGREKKDASAAVFSVQPSQIKPGKRLKADERVDKLSNSRLPSLFQTQYST